VVLSVDFIRSTSDYNPTFKYSRALLSMMLLGNAGRHDEYYQWVGDSDVYIHWSERLVRGAPLDDIVSVALNTSKGLLILREGEIY
jgi:hypothetical protein